MSFDRDCSVQGWPDYDGLVNSKTKRLWTPNQRATRLWLDFSDTSTLTVTSGALESVVDKSGNSITFSQTTAANRPSYIASSTNGLPAIDCVASGNRFMDSTTSIQTSNTGSMTLLFAGTQRTTEGTIFTERGTTLIQSFSTVSSSLMSDGLNVSSNHTTSSAILTGETILIYQHVPGQQGRIWQNGTEWVMTAGVCSNITGAAGSRLGRREASTGFNWNGLMYEVVAELATLNDATRQLYEGYFAWKRGVASLLPSNHPYKNAAPTV